MRIYISSVVFIVLALVSLSYVAVKLNNFNLQIAISLR